MWYGKNADWEDYYIQPRQPCKCKLEDLDSQLENKLLKQLLEEHFIKVLEKDE